MSKIAVVTDSTAYLSDEQIKENDIHVVPLNVIFGDISYQESVDLKADAFYELIKTSDKLPTTSQPAVGVFAELFEKLQSEGVEDVICIHLSSKLSGTFQSAVSASTMVEGIKIHPIDSEIASSPLAFYALEAAQLAKAGKSVEEIILKVEEMKSKNKAYFVVDDLNHLHRGGRMNAAQLLVGSLLKIKPILHLVDGKIVPFEKVRTQKKALAKIFSMLEEDVKQNEELKIAIVQAKREDQAKEIADELQAKYPKAHISISFFGPVLGTHLGEGSLAICWNYS
ncbi:DegV family protein [Bacillus alkalicellulosilyticus]|uniref:DegV family protein n=1 Tax=Alkalihalobacterium alkalicellulosilyticum TaxID=1912214 RepID=UPI0009983224|nr:DegV family protein [Bacillus alkalicellulosilyticus]